ncbi:hypothetical protein SOV_33290 [Sporomusa ovata DSM 2662]|uniref:Uncharacterized protein n=1 Tax=Sporomusa ovata TaxID=2378 RepID=A0A0U1L2B9_9FIRM|nr:DUF4363 family protein [Sporomusa ovata]EQB25264.1 hypothetical protein SOV_5c04320 [Sporomusa ovata DSM 2662]CQR73827.1 hypothetical protein SpAn4DRAFT_0289 [Sporomusa ovata]
MFDRTDMRQYIGIGWLMAFAALWLSLWAVLPRQEMTAKVEELEQNVSHKNWPRAEQNLAELEETYQKNRLVMQIANSAEEIVVFRERLGEAKALVKHQQEGALAAIGAIKQAAKDATDPFPGP